MSTHHGVELGSMLVAKGRKEGRIERTGKFAKQSTERGRSEQVSLQGQEQGARPRTEQEEQEEAATGKEVPDAPIMEGANQSNLPACSPSTVSHPSLIICLQSKLKRRQSVILPRPFRPPNAYTLNSGIETFFNMAIPKREMHQVPCSGTGQDKSRDLPFLGPPPRNLQNNVPRRRDGWEAFALRVSSLVWWLVVHVMPFTDLCLP